MFINDDVYPNAYDLHRFRYWYANEVKCAPVYWRLEHAAAAERVHRAETYHLRVQMVRGRFAANLRGPERRWRLSATARNRWQLSTAIDKWRAFGRALAECIATRDDSALENLYEYHYSTLRRVADKVTNEWFQDSVTTCDRCGDVLPVSMGCDVRRERGAELWCQSCVENHASNCADCGELFATSGMIDVTNYGLVCESCYDSGRFFVCEACDTTFHEDDYEGDGLCHGCYEDRDDDDDDDSDYDGLSSYHSSNRDWQILNEYPNDPFENAPPTGIEIEVYAQDRAEAVAALKDFAETDDYPSPLLLERDGSLSESCGFEIITHPMGLTEHRKYNAALLELLRKHNVCGWSGKNGTYGIHITLHRGYLSPLQEARMMMFLAAEENAEFVRAIAQRHNIYAADLNIGALPNSEQHVAAVSVGGMRTMQYRGKQCRKIGGAGKYAPINFKENLAEIRIFQSTLHKESFFKNIEFVYALVEWTRPESATGSRWHYKDFLQWLVARPRFKKTYPNLCGYLKRVTFPIKHGGTVANPWREMFVKD